MKKIIALTALAVSLVAGTAAFAADYTAGNNEVTGVDASGYATVLIIKDGSSNISDAVYVDQAQSGSMLSEATRFLLKSNPADGIYTLKLGGGDAETKISKFYIGMPITDNDIKSSVSFIEDAEEGDTKKVSFGWESVNPHGYSTLILKLDDKVYGHELGTYVDGDMDIGFVISEIPKSVEKADAYFSETGMSSLNTKKGASEE